MRKKLTKRQCETVLDRLRAAYPDAGCALSHGSAFELTVAVVLSAQTTDRSVNTVTPALFARFPDPAALAAADEETLRDILRPIGMYKTKARNIKALAIKLIEDCGGTVPADFDTLIGLPGVGRKTANVVLATAFGEQHIAVDTHVFRVANRIGLCREADVLQTERALMRSLPENRWIEAHHSLIFHGRRCCAARKPDCENCPIRDICLAFPVPRAARGRRSERDVSGETQDESQAERKTR